MTVKKELRWKRLIDTGKTWSKINHWFNYPLNKYVVDVLCDSYSQRVFASFGLLDSYNKGYFTLDDFVKRGLIVEEFLSLNVNTGTSFHVMVNFVLFKLIIWSAFLAESTSVIYFFIVATEFFSWVRCWWKRDSADWRICGEGDWKIR